MNSWDVSQVVCPGHFEKLLKGFIYWKYSGRSWGQSYNQNGKVLERIASWNR
jgi:hypothetical protein